VKGGTIVDEGEYFPRYFAKSALRAGVLLSGFKKKRIQQEKQEKKGENWASHICHDTIKLRKVEER
jgi:hypothetical protein